MMSKKHKKVFLYGFKLHRNLLILGFAVTRQVSISSFILDRFQFPLSTIGLKTCATTAGIKKYKSIIKRKWKKHDKIVLLTKIKLNSI